MSFFSKTTILGIGPRFILSVKTCFLNLWAMWAFEYCILIASYISATAFASQVVLLQLTLIFLTIPFGFGVVANDLIADSIAFYDHVEAKATANIFQEFAIGCAIIMVALAVLLRNPLIGLYTTDTEVTTQIALVWVPFMVFLLGLAINLVVSGALQPVHNFVNHLVYGFTQSAYWILAAPVCLIGVFTFDETLKTLWVCLAVFTMLIAPITFFLLRSIDFMQVVAARKLEDEEKSNIEMAKLEQDDNLQCAINL